MYEKSILATLIASAVEDCRDLGSGQACDEEMGTDLCVRANWIDIDEVPVASIIEICVIRKIS